VRAKVENGGADEMIADALTKTLPGEKTSFEKNETGSRTIGMRGFTEWECWKYAVHPDARWLRWCDVTCICP
jgi:hypothetical protein